jgi:large subunit ribosomal protein L15
VKLHDLRPAAGSRKSRTRVGRGIAAGQGKTAGRGTKGQKARAGASIPAWFEGGQTPIHVRVPKLRGFRNAFKVEYQVVNIGRIAEYAAAGRFGVEVEGQPAPKAKKGASAPVSVNPAALASAGLIGTENKPVKILGQGDVSAALFVAAEAFTASARSKIEAAGGFVQLLAADGAPAPDDKPAQAKAEVESPKAEAKSPKAEAKSPKAEAKSPKAEAKSPKAEATADAEAEAPEAAPTAEAQATAEAVADEPATTDSAEPAEVGDAEATEEPKPAKPATRRRKASEE